SRAGDAPPVSSACRPRLLKAWDAPSATIAASGTTIDVRGFTVARRPVPRHKPLAPANDVAAAPDRETVRIAIGAVRRDPIPMGARIAPASTAPSLED